MSIECSHYNIIYSCLEFIFYIFFIVGVIISFKKNFFLNYLFIFGRAGPRGCPAVSRWGVGLLSVCGVWASHCSGPSWLSTSSRAWELLQSRHTGSAVQAVVPGARPGRYGTAAELFRGMWNLTAAGFKPVALALVGRFLTTGLPGKAYHLLL